MFSSTKLLKLSSIILSKTSKHVVDLTNVDNFSYSAIMREITKCSDDEQIKHFLILYKEYFDLAEENKIDKPEFFALQNAIIEYSKKYKIIIPDNFIKKANISHLGSAEDIGHYISNVIKFLMSKISDENKARSMSRLKGKLINLNSNELANKDMPASASIGQSITFVKNVLFNHDPSFIKEVLRHTVNKL